MAWQIPTPGQWNPGVALAPDPSSMDMGSFTADQWNLLQQQNWQQWAQWQQQYAQWQTQYGDKYAEQMQAIQAMGLAPHQITAPLPAPPPPEDPPPPPHENDQPLYGNLQTPVLLQSNLSQSYSAQAGNNFNMNTGNIQNWSYDVDGRKSETSPQVSLVNSEALKKLAEEERLFDIQFQKWEEEIAKWKKENVNHPDKRAYSEYEQKFEACRAQLLERRQQMKQKRARLLNNVPQSTNTSNPGNNISSSIPPSLQNPNYNENNQSSQIVKPPQNYPHKNTVQHQQYNSNFRQNYNRSNKKSVDPQDRCESYGDFDDYGRQNMNKDYPPKERNDAHSNEGAGNASFLPSSRASKGIPGLDLVPEADKGLRQDVIEITDTHEERHIPSHAVRTAPDYSTISRGINNILGDEKIMNILSMVQSQKPPGQNALSVSHTDTSVMPPDGPWNRNQYYDNRSTYENKNQDSTFDNRYNSNYGNRPLDSSNYDNLGNQQQGSFENKPDSANYNIRPPVHNTFGNRPPLLNNFSNRAPNNIGNRPALLPNNFNNRPPMPHNNYDVRQPLLTNLDNRQQNNFNIRPENNSYDKRRNMPPNKQNMNNYPMQLNYHDQSQDAYNENPEKKYVDTYDQYGKDCRPPIAGNRPAPRPLLQINTDIQMPENYPVPVPIKSSWSEDPLFSPSIIVEYEHKSLRLKARGFIEPVHTFDYDHKSKDEDIKKRDFEKEVNDLYVRKPRTSEKENSRNRYSRDYDRRMPPDNVHDDYKQRPPLRDDHYGFREERPRIEERLDSRRHDDRDRFHRREDFYRDRERELITIRDVRERDFGRDREMVRERDLGRSRDTGRDYGWERDLDKERGISREKDESRDRMRELDIRDRDTGRYIDKDRERHQSNSCDKESRKRSHSIELSDASSKKGKKVGNQPHHIVMIDDLLEEPGRSMRPQKIVIILRGPPGSGKSYLAKLIRDREAEHGNAVRIMSIDDYFMQEGEIEERDSTGKIVKKPSLKYEYDEKLEESYINSLKRAFRKSITDGFFPFLIFDAVNDQLKSYADIWNFARQNGFQVYICTMDLDAQACFKRNIHGRTLEEIEAICSRFFETPVHHIHLDPTTLLQNAAITEVTMEDAVSMEDVQETEVENSFTSKWERMDDVNQLARLDGTSKPLRPKLSMEDYLQLDEWIPNTAKPGKKTVRWADIEERREQEKMRAIGFVVGQTDWNRMTDPTMGSSALTKTKYIERVKRN